MSKEKYNKVGVEVRQIPLRIVDRSEDPENYDKNNPGNKWVLVETKSGQRVWVSKEDVVDPLDEAELVSGVRQWLKATQFNSGGSDV